MPVALKDAASTKILRTLVNKFGGSAHAVVLDGDLRRYPQVNDGAARFLLMRSDHFRNHCNLTHVASGPQAPRRNRRRCRRRSASCIAISQRPSPRAPCSNQRPRSLGAAGVCACGRRLSSKRCTTAVFRWNSKVALELLYFARKRVTLRAAAATRWVAAAKRLTTAACRLSLPHWQAAPASPPPPMPPLDLSFPCLSCSRTLKQALGLLSILLRAYPPLLTTENRKIRCRLRKRPSRRPQLPHPSSRCAQVPSNTAFWFMLHGSHCPCV